MPVLAVVDAEARGVCSRDCAGEPEFEIDNGAGIRPAGNMAENLMNRIRMNVNDGKIGVPFSSEW